MAEKMTEKAARRSLDLNRQVTTPIRVPRTLRGHEISTLTSLPAGRVVPVAAAPLLREDQVRTGKVRLSFEMHETAEILMNAVHCNVKAYLVPFLAFERFQGLDDLNRSYAGEVARPGGQVTPFFDTEVRGAIGTNDILEYLGLHADPADTINTAYVEAYNTIWNFRAKNRSPQLTERNLDAKDLAPAFWRHERYKHIVPDFDQAMIDGEVALNIVDSQTPVTGIGIRNAGTPGTNISVLETGASGSRTYAGGWDSKDSPTAGQAGFTIEEDPDNLGFPHIYAELQADGITVSLSNIDAAKKTAAFARVREQYEGLDDEWIIDMLMSGLTVPEQAMKQPMLLAQQDTVFGMAKRFASDGANLTESVVNGATFVDLNLRVPRVSTGGVIMITAECTPDQLFERQQDPLLKTTTVVELPEYLRDELDPEKVEVVENKYVDTDHATPAGTFGYAPLNHEWDIKARRVGGRFYRPEVDGTADEDRERIWSVEQANPTLSEDFYLATNIHTKPFADQTIDPFEVVAVGQMVIEGNTVFGGALIESAGQYDTVLAKVPTARIAK